MQDIGDNDLVLAVFDVLAEPKDNISERGCTPERNGQEQFSSIEYVWPPKNCSTFSVRDLSK